MPYFPRPVDANGGTRFLIFDKVAYRILLVLLICSGSLHGQVNLVPNPSFEWVDTCPYNQDQLYFASPWFKPNPNSSDLYNRCSSFPTSTIPQNWLGFQEPHTADGYAGIGAYGYTYNGVDNRREYLAVRLTDSLTAGKKYCVEFYASRADSSYWAINRLGLHLSEYALNDNLAIDTLTAIPQIMYDTNSIFTDTMNWVKISGVYLAEGGEQYITIGNFYADDQTDTLADLYNRAMAAYFYIDDVAVYELQDCEAGIDVSMCYQDSVQMGGAPRSGVSYSWFPSAGLSDAAISNPIASPETTTTYILEQTECGAILYDTVTVVVNHNCHTAPAIIIPTLVHGNQEFFIPGLEANSALDWYDARGRIVYSSSNYENNFWPLALEQGIYVVCLNRPNGERIIKKVCLIR